MLLKVVLGLLAVLVLAVIGIQIFLPDRVASDIEARLTEGGGTASAEVESLPAVRLIWADGDRIEVSGSDLVLDVENDVEVLDRLDGFDQVDVSLENVEAGPFQVSTFELRRQGGGAYTLRSDATTSGTELLEFGAEALGPLAGPIGGLLGGNAPDEASEPFEVELDAQLVSVDGQIEITEGGGTVAGYDVGPLAELITAAVVSRLVRGRPSLADEALAAGRVDHALQRFEGAVLGVPAELLASPRGIHQDGGRKRVEPGDLRRQAWEP